MSFIGNGNSNMNCANYSNVVIENSRDNNNVNRRKPSGNVIKK